MARESVYFHCSLFSANVAQHSLEELNTYNLS